MRMIGNSSHQNKPTNRGTGRLVYHDGHAAHNVQASKSRCSDWRGCCFFAPVMILRQTDRQTVSQSNQDVHLADHSRTNKWRQKRERETASSRRISSSSSLSLLDLCIGPDSNSDSFVQSETKKRNNNYKSLTTTMKWRITMPGSEMSEMLPIYILLSVNVDGWTFSSFSTSVLRMYKERCFPKEGEKKKTFSSNQGQIVVFFFAFGDY